MSWFDTLLWPIKLAVAWIMVTFHSLAEPLGIDPESGLAWALSIVGLVVVIRILLIPLFVRQINASRAMQMLSPELQAIQKKYKGKTDPASREAMSRETMALYSKHGTNPFSSCLPILAQSPIFFALFRVLYNLPAVADGTYAKESIGVLTQDLARQATDATLFGAPISSYFLEANATSATRAVTVVLIVLMSLTTFTTQRQLTQKNMPASALTGPMAQQQKMLLYVLPLVFAFSGVNFPIGVLIYWTTTNLWSMGQQFYVIRRNPTPGSAAERELKERRARKAAAKGIVLEEEKPAIEEKPRGQRQQPKRKDRDRPVQRPVGDTTADEAPGPDTESGSAAKRTGGAQRSTPRPASGENAPARKPRRRPSEQGSASAGASTGTTPARPRPAAKPAIEPTSDGAGAPRKRRRPADGSEGGPTGTGRRPRSAGAPGDDKPARKPRPKPERDAPDETATPEQADD
ncbi:membrane protein insertase YidC [Actinotalea sp.]|uniref:membrane protein insertase YidC n=1 Tax=Actinotalea sp. TaxID=1872145 RepID=UPI003566C1E6